jgi:hypothetical protein
MLDGLGQGQILLADRGYDSIARRSRLASKGAWGNIKPIPNRVNVPSFSAYLYRFEISSNASSTNSSISRAVATRNAVVKLAAIRIWFRFMSRCPWVIPP